MKVFDVSDKHGHAAAQRFIEETNGEATVILRNTDREYQPPAVKAGQGRTARELARCVDGWWFAAMACFAGAVAAGVALGLCELVHLLIAVPA